MMEGKSHGFYLDDREVSTHVACGGVNCPDVLDKCPNQVANGYVKKVPEKVSMSLQTNDSIKILLLEDVSQGAVDMLLDKKYDVKVVKGSLSKKELIEAINDVHVLGIRSRTAVTSDVLEHARNLLCIGCFCIGTNQVDLDGAADKGIAVFNSPYQNSRSVAELIIGVIIALSRHLGDRNVEMHRSMWSKTSRNCFEVRGKTLGIVGYGHIGSQVSVLAESLGMRVMFYDVASPMALGNSRSMDSLESLLAESDIVTLHVPQTELTVRMITKREIEMMKKGALLLNASRGNVVDLGDLQNALESQHLGGAYLDVFPLEPMSNGPIHDYDGLASRPNVILTPHIGGCTLEAQRAIGDEVASKIVSFLHTGKTVGSVNFPEIELLPIRSNTHRIFNVHENKPGVLKEINNILSVYNVEGQVLKTNRGIGYFIADIDSETLNGFGDRIATLASSIRTRVIYHHHGVPRT